MSDPRSSVFSVKGLSFAMVFVSILGAASVFLALALSAGGETPTPIPTFTPVAGLRVVTPDPNLPQPGIATPATQTAQQLVSTLRVELGNIRVHLRVALGDFSSCPSPCSIPTEFADVI